MRGMKVDRKPILVKFTPEDLERLDAAAAASGMTRMARIVAYVQDGMAGEKSAPKHAAPEREPSKREKLARAKVIHEATAARLGVSTAAPEPRHVDLPLGPGTVVYGSRLKGSSPKGRKS